MGPHPGTDDSGPRRRQAVRRTFWASAETQCRSGKTRAAAHHGRKRRKRDRSHLQSPPDNDLPPLSAGGLTGFSVPLIPNTELARNLATEQVTAFLNVLDGS